MEAAVVNEIFLMLALIFLGGMIGGAIAKKLGLPDVVVFLLVGIIIGPYGLHLLGMHSGSLTVKLILTAGTSFILYLGGREVGLMVINKVLITIILLSTIGILISASIVGITSHYLLGIPLSIALLMGAIISPTDPAALIPIFKQYKIKERVAQTVESESAFNDATGSVLVITMLSVIFSGQFSLNQNLLLFFKDAGIGIISGLVIGIAGTILISKKKYGYLNHFSPIMSVFVAISSYLVADSLGGSGFMASFIAGIVCGNKVLFHLHCSGVQNKIQENVNETFGLIMRMMIFIVLGTMINFHIIFEYFWVNLLIIFVFIFVARPLTVFACTLPDINAHWNNRERLFMCWVRETGVMPAALTGMLLGKNIAYIDHIASIAFMAIIITLLLQATTTNMVASKLGLIEA